MPGRVDFGVRISDALQGNLKTLSKADFEKRMIDFSDTGF